MSSSIPRYVKSGNPGYTMLNINYDSLDAIYQASNFFEDDKVLDILNEHRNIEQGIIDNPGDVLINKDFHEQNIQTIDYIIENIKNGHQNCDALVYLYPFLIYRYSGTIYDNSVSVQKFQEYFSKLNSLYRNNNLEIGFLCSQLIAYFHNRNLVSYKEDIVNYLTKFNDNSLGQVFQFCKALLYNKEFCGSLFSYEGSQRHGAYVLFDIIIYKIISYANRGVWIENFIRYFEKHRELQLNFMQDYYLTFAKLIKCVYLSNNVISDTLIQEFNSIMLPDFEINENTFELYYLYNQRLTFWDNVGKQDKVLTICNNLLFVLSTANENSREGSYIKERVNWRKSNALMCLGNKQEHIEWFFNLLSKVSFEKITSEIFLSPFIEQSEIDIPLYHFTDLDAMKSIIEKGSLWLTRFDFLNDTEEIKYITMVIRDSLAKLRGKKLSAFIERCLCIVDFCFGNESDGSISEDDKRIASLIKDSLSSIYVLSTSNKDDNLSLWHYYTKGSGCSIKINSKDLKAHFSGLNSPVANNSTPIFMNNIKYTDKASELTSLKTLKTIFKADPCLSTEHKLFIACVHIICEGIFIKNPNMDQEKEFRIAVISPAYRKNNQVETKFRVSKNTFIPYIELNINAKASIQEICIAPLNKIDTAKKGLIEFLKNKGFDNSDEMVKVSAIKLRY